VVGGQHVGLKIGHTPRRGHLDESVENVGAEPPPPPRGDRESELGTSVRQQYETGIRHNPVLPRDDGYQTAATGLVETSLPFVK
jgi:hypothetical protein